MPKNLSKKEIEKDLKLKKAIIEEIYQNILVKIDEFKKIGKNKK